MKSILFAAISLTALASNAVQVQGARLDADAKSILIDVAYGGGCKEHKFELQVSSCLESMPVQCTAKIVDLTTDDYCEAYLSETVKISLESAGLNDEYYSGASLSISGSSGSANVQLPR